MFAKIHRTAWAVLIVTLLAPSLAAAQPVSVHADLELLSRYVWRGSAVTSDPVLQPAAGARLGLFTAGIWANLDLTDVNDYAGKFNEIDYTLAYELGLPLVSLAGGLIYYTYPNTGLSSTTEAFVAGKVGVLLSPSLAIYADVDEADGIHVRAGIGHDFTLGTSTPLAMRAELGWGGGNYNRYYHLATGGVSDALLSAGVPWSPIPFLTVTPTLSFAALVGNPRDAAPAGVKKDNVIFGVTVSAGF